MDEIHYVLMHSELNSIEMRNILEELIAKHWNGIGCNFHKMMIKCMGMALHQNHSHEVIELFLCHYPAVLEYPISEVCYLCIMHVSGINQKQLFENSFVHFQRQQINKTIQK